jgi:hypothetical protein
VTGFYASFRRWAGAIFAAAILLLGGRGHAHQSPDFSLYDNRILFAAGGGVSLPDMKLFRDPLNNQVGLACLNRPPLSQLDRLAIPDLAQRITALEKGSDLKRRDGRCELTFPVFAGPRRRELQSLVDNTAGKLLPQMEQIRRQLQNKLETRQDMLFHLLWSRVMDDAWDASWKISFHENGLPDAVWVVFPGQPIDVGTNYNSAGNLGAYSLTWSAATRPQLHEFSESANDAFRIVWGKDVPASASKTLQRFGLLTADAKPQVFAFHAGDPMDQILGHLQTEYARLVSPAYDYAAVGKRFGVPADRMFLILQHETAWALLGRLNQSGKLEVPPVLLGNGDERQFVRLLSLKLTNPPGPDDDAMYLFVKSGWRGNQETAAAFRRVLDQNPANLDACLYLGFSLYEIKDYPGALAAFSELIAHAGTHRSDGARMKDWGRIWAAHMHDLLGEREQALAIYREVAKSEDTSQMMFGQYDLGPIAARDWAKERLDTPFTRR